MTLEPPLARRPESPSCRGPVPRSEFLFAATEVYRAYYAVERAARHGRIDPALRELVNVRVSEVNECSYGLAVHRPAARFAGVTPSRIRDLRRWRESAAFTSRERAALAWAEAVTRPPPGGIPEDAYRDAIAYFSAGELADLTLATVVINGWNRLALAFDLPVPADTPLPNEAGHALA